MMTTYMTSNVLEIGRLLEWCRYRLSVLGLVLMLAACGGGGGGSDAEQIIRDNLLGNRTPTTTELNAASLLSSHATFGLSFEALEDVAREGRLDWLDSQLDMAPTLHTPVVQDLIGQLERDELSPDLEDVDYLIRFRRFAWWNRALTAPDVVRQKAAYALSQIFVVSDNVDVLSVNPLSLSGYYDVLLENAFGNFRDLLEAVTYHPAMGVYLSHVNNAKANPALNTFPDENFAREIMQLFTIGLFELNEDGTEQLDAGGAPIPSYDNDDISNFARVFTGLSYGAPNTVFGQQFPEFGSAMQMFEQAHDTDAKTLLNGVELAAGQTGDQDISAALDNLFNHPNVGPFISRQLIQRMVTSNPSPAYVARVTAVFNGDNGNVRGDMRAVFRAILTDTEATNPNVVNGGRVREPIEKIVAMARQLNATSADGLFYTDGFAQQFILQQHPLSAPSVFNFFLPNHTPAGALADAGLVSPELQIINATTIVGYTNLVNAGAIGSFILDVPEPFADVSLDLSGYITLVETEGIQALIDRLNIVFLHGDMSSDLEDLVVATLEELDSSELRARTALYLLLMSPEYAVNV